MNVISIIHKLISAKLTHKVYNWCYWSLPAMLECASLAGMTPTSSAHHSRSLTATHPVWFVSFVSQQLSKVQWSPCVILPQPNCYTCSQHMQLLAAVQSSPWPRKPPTLCSSIVVCTCGARSIEVSWTIFAVATSCGICVELEEAEVDGCGDGTLPVTVG